MTSLYLRCAAVLMALAVAAFGAAESWSGLNAMRSLLPVGRVVGYWATPEAAFVAVSVPEKGVQSAVSLGGRTTIVHAGSVSVTGAPASKIDSLDFNGVTTGGYAVLFYTEPQMARSTASFDTGSREDALLNFVVTGLAPGTWEVWRNGWIIDSDASVRPREGVLSFKAKSGSYFLRRLTN